MMVVELTEENYMLVDNAREVRDTFREHMVPTDKYAAMHQHTGVNDARANIENIAHQNKNNTEDLAVSGERIKKRVRVDQRVII